MENSLKIAIAEDYGGTEKIDLNVALGISEDRRKFLHKRMAELAPKFCKTPCNGTCSIFAIRELAPELLHVNELFYLAYASGYITAEQLGAGSATVSIINLGGRR